MGALEDGYFGVCSFMSRTNCCSGECGPNGLPLTPPSIAIIGRFQFLTSLRHPNLCQYLDIQRGKFDRIFVISEHYCKCVHDLVNENKRRRFELLPKIAYETLSALQYLHNCHICHRYLSGENVLLNEKGTVRLSNYGLYYMTDSGRNVPFHIQHAVYSAPEVYVSDMNSQPTGPKGDICYTLEKEPVLDSLLLHFQETAKWISEDGDPNLADILQLISNSLTLKPSARPSAEELLKFAIFNKFSVNETPPCLGNVFFASHFSKTEKLNSMVDLNYMRFSQQPFRLRPIEEIYFLWKLSGSTAEATLSKKKIIQHLPPLLCLPDVIFYDFQMVGHEKERVQVVDLKIYPLTMKNLINKLSSLNCFFYWPLFETELPGLDESFHFANPGIEHLAVVVKEKDVIYQLRRMAILHRCLEAFPYTKDKLVVEARSDIPPLYRGYIWTALLDVPCTIGYKYANIDKESPTAADRQIEVDIPRCHQYDELLSSPTAHEKFKRIIKAWIVSHPHYVYWQGLDSLCAPFLHLNFSNESLAYGCLSSFIDNFLKDFFLKDNSEVMQEYLGVFKMLIAFYNAKLYNHLSKVNFQPELYAIPWFLTMFAHVLPLHKLFHVWDVLLLGGNAFPLCIGAAVLCDMEDRLLHCEFNECIILFSDVPEINVENCLKKALEIYQLAPKTLLYQRRLSAVFVNGKSNCRLDPFSFTLQVGTQLGLHLEEADKDDVAPCPEICAEEMLFLSERKKNDINNSLIIVDVRDKEDFDHYCIPGSINIPYSSAFEDGNFLLPSMLKNLLNKHYYMTVIVGSGSDLKARQFTLLLIGLNYSRICLLHRGIEVLWERRNL
ncbi:TBC domain-containing protein kinase-like protein [Trichinella pseudospiralis]|uniref:TBC domain-containing protein kinase-like protein n=1 Tax=Trichinella pseudospiralis TaxID=6337 RepID=A0A0V1JID8_TRIPS|nr:TBC domain-containing protein kinase-like protein [Trichinella pseudospiralis]KRZ34737.1 TBC domain-containing protein kinase-like protein [Trichinella pseudospiralis]KRZ46332.1 TBC domain-containing protein kinase-like protein [Trichinella pseudospiralis]